MGHPSLQLSMQDFLNGNKQGASLNDKYFFIINHKPIRAKIDIAGYHIEIPDINDIILEKGTDGNNCLFFLPQSFIFENPKTKRTLSDMTCVNLHGDNISMNLQQEKDEYILVINIG